jgi:hypothetical protein
VSDSKSIAQHEWLSIMGSIESTCLGLQGIRHKPEQAAKNIVLRPSSLKDKI